MGDEILSIGAPFELGEVVSLREGTKVKITFWDEMAASRLRGKFCDGLSSVPMFVVGLPSSVTKVQRRSFVRVPAAYSVTFQSVTKEGLSDFHQASMFNLSGGGMRFLTEGTGRD